MSKNSSFQRDILSITFKTLIVLVLLGGYGAMTTPDPLKTGFKLTGGHLFDRFGESVRTAGDIDNDGYDDIIIGADNFETDVGAAYVIYGGPTSSLSDIDLGLTALDPAKTGFMITGNAHDFLGASISTAGDFNNDGYDDIIVPAPCRGDHQGVVYVIYGGPRSSMSNIDFNHTVLDPLTTGFMITGNAADDTFGGSVSTAGDINHDGYGDIIIGAATKDSEKGAAYVIYGAPKSSSSNIDLSSTTLDPATTGFMISGNATQDMDFGLSVNRVGDINHDGYDDIIVESFVKGVNQATAYVIYGAPKSSSSNINLTLTTLDPATTGFMISGIAYTSLGLSVATAGDINHDGFSDIIVGADFANNQIGAVYVIYGGPKSSASNIDLKTTTLDPAKTGFMISGNAARDHFGWAVSTTGDFNNDGYDDIIVGASEKSVAKGAAYVIYGGPKSSASNIDLKTTTLDPAKTGFMISGNAIYNWFGLSVATAGDINNDGFKDVIIGAPWELTKGTAYVIFGRPKPSMTNIVL